MDDRKLNHGWPESITSQARSAQRCRMRSFSLHEAFVKQARDSTRQGALRKLVGASWSAQVALRKLHCASCSAQVAPRKLLRQVGPCKWLRASCSVQIALPASCSVQAALCKLLCLSSSASCSRQGALRKLVGASWSAQVALCNLLCASCSAQVALKCKLHLATPTRGPGRNRTRDPPVPGAGARTTRQLPRISSNNQKSQKTLATPIPAEGCASTAEIAKTSGFCTSTTPQKPWVFARRFPQRVARAPQKSQKNLEFLHADPRRGSRGNLENRKKKHWFLHLDHADPRRGLRGNFRNRKKTWVVAAPRPRRSPQRVAREL